ncbi:carbohydrate ABC transporter membrane protein 2, CUT1 family [Haladaptatus litoreus]|uniref:Carbohydrate ABC transporter membrane protein 2, CUT1 family n=1 Tax=Haladaptatus litoreus TaxID=553468 RepID=A0A1N7EL17_9EURY|nr:carbohydrate ABC transporter permease [Haladaptatus litoreus]SIR88754.1 carbohydrate ABC transporter membrane protein 2, CUT1 family [Haladaptatus litoreus]
MSIETDDSGVFADGQERLSEISGKKVLVYVALTIGVILPVFPFALMVSMSFKPASEIYSLQVIPSTFTLENYRFLLENVPIVRQLINSIIVTGAVVVSVVITSCIVAYSLAKLDWYGRGVTYNFILATMMIPGILLLIPQFVIIVELGWVNTYQAMIAPFAISSFGIFLLTQFFKQFPDSLIDAARMDGCSELDIVFRIVLPNSMPAIATVAIFTFMNRWNQMLWDLIVIKNESMYTLPVSITLFAKTGLYGNSMGPLMAGATLLALPTILLFLLLRRYFIKGVTMSGLKV